MGTSYFAVKFGPLNCGRGSVEAVGVGWGPMSAKGCLNAFADMNRNDSCHGPSRVTTIQKEKLKIWPK